MFYGSGLPTASSRNCRCSSIHHPISLCGSCFAPGLRGSTFGLSNIPLDLPMSEWTLGAQ